MNDADYIEHLARRRDRLERMYLAALSDEAFINFFPSAE